MKNVCFYFLCTFWLKRYSFQAELSHIQSHMYIGLHVNFKSQDYPHYTHRSPYADDETKNSTNQDSSSLEI
jgi:hypothetical protein